MRGRWLVVSSVAFLAVSSIFACSSFGSSDTPGVDAGDEAGSGDGAIPADSGSPTTDGARDSASDGDVVPLPSTVVLSSGWLNVRSIAADETSVYFTEQGKGFVHVASLDPGLTGGMIGGQGSPTSIAVAAGVVYWCDTGAAGGVLYHAASNGSGAASTAPVGENAIFVVNATATNIVTLSHQPANNDVGSVEARFPTQLDSFQVVSSSTMDPFDVTFQDDVVYWTESANQGAVAKTGITGGSRTVVSGGESDCRFITSDANGVYWTRTTDKLVRGVVDGGAPQDIATGEAGPTAIASDGKALYWVNSLDGTIRRLRAGPKSAETIASGFTAVQDLHARSLALTSRYVVWLTNDGMVLSHEK